MKTSSQRWIGAVALGLLSAGCAGGPRPADFPGEAAPVYEALPGVDSMVVVRAFAEADSSFVGPEREAAADRLLEEGKKAFTESDTLYSLRKILALSAGSTIEVTVDDSARAISYLNRAYGEYEDVERLFGRYLEAGGGPDALGETIRSKLEAARSAAVESIRANPFDPDARLLLSVIHRYLARVFGEEDRYREAISVLNGLIEMDRGDPALRYELGYDQYQVEAWSEALDAFRTAETLLYENAAVEAGTPAGSASAPPPDSAGAIPRGASAGIDSAGVSPGASIPPASRFASVPVDTVTLLNYVWYEADCLTRLYRSDEAIRSYRRALTLARSEEDGVELRASIDWILWDDGNIHSAEVRDSLIRVERDGDYEAARRGYLELRPSLTRKTAIDEIDWKVATIDYQFRDDPDAGIERLRGLIDRAVERGVVTPAGAPADPSSRYADYVNDYGTMCFNLGMKRLAEKRRRREAFAYFLQAAAIEWENRGTCYVELLKLVGNNPDLTIRYGEEALGQRLSREERLFVLKQLTTACKRKGSRADFEKARAYFGEWKRLSRGGGETG